MSSGECSRVLFMTGYLVGGRMIVLLAAMGD
jgi:hypothetical protein